MGKKKKAGGAAPTASTSAGVEDERSGVAAPLWVERRRLEEDWGRSAPRVWQGLEAWRGALQRLLSVVQEAPPPTTASSSAAADGGSSNSGITLAAAVPCGPGVNAAPAQAWALRLEAGAEAAREGQGAALALLERLDARCRAFREQIRLATTVSLVPPPPPPTATDDHDNDAEKTQPPATAPESLALSAAFESSASAGGGVGGLAPTLLKVEEGLRGAWATYETLEHLAAAIDAAALSAPASRERLSVLALLLREDGVVGAAWGEE